MRNSGCVAHSATLDFGLTAFFAAGQKKYCGQSFGHISDFFEFAVGEKNNKAPFLQFAYEAKKKIMPIFLFAVVDKNKLATFAIRRRVLLFFRRFLLFTVTENKLKGVFRYSQELFIGKHVLVLAVG